MVKSRLLYQLSYLSIRYRSQGGCDAGVFLHLI